MTDAEYEVQLERVRRLIEKWAKPIGLNWWRAKYVYDRDRCPEDAKRVMDCSSSWKYGWFQITAYLPVVMTREDNELEEDFVHELMHVFLTELRNLEAVEWEAHKEHVATVLAKAFIWLREHVETEGAARTVPAPQWSGSVST